jgi:hypothetical protein
MNSTPELFTLTGHLLLRHACTFYLLSGPKHLRTSPQHDRLQRKMATCIDLTYGKAVSTALSVEAKYASSGKNKGFRRRGNGSSSGLLAKTALFLVHQHSLSNSPLLFAPTIPPLPQISRVPQALDSLPCPALQLGVSTAASRDILSKTAHTPSKISPMLSKDLGSPLSPKGILWEGIPRKQGVYTTPRWPLHRKESR